MPFIRFMASPIGRIARIVVGVVLLILGLAVIGGAAGTILAIVGLVLIAVGIFDICLLAPLFGAPFRRSAG